MKTRYYLIAITDNEIAVSQIAATPLVFQSLWPEFLRRKRRTEHAGMADASWLWGLLHFLPPIATQGAMRAGEN